MTPMVTRSRTAAAGATAAAVRFELGEAARRLAQARADESAELDRLAALFTAGTQAGLRVDEIAGTVGISRQTLLDACTSGRGAPERLDVDLRLACALGAGEARSERTLAGAVAHGPIQAHEVAAALARLVEAGDARLVSAGAAGESCYRLTEHGAARLPHRLRQATMSPAREWIVHVASTPAEAAAIARIAESLLGTHEVSVIPAGAGTGTQAPEVTWRVEASCAETAIQAAIGRMRELRDDVGGLDPGEPVVVVAVVHPADSR